MSKIIRDGVEVDVPRSQMTDEERRAYDRAAKQRSREKIAEAKKVATAEPKDEFTIRFLNLSPKDRRDFCLANPRFVQADFPVQLEKAQQALFAPMMETAIKRTGYGKSELVQEIESFIREEVLSWYGLSEPELNSILDGSYKVPSLEFSKPNTEGMEWREVTGGHWSHVLVPVGAPDSIARKIAGCGDDGRPVPPVTNHAENIRATQEVKEAITETSMQRLEKFEHMTGVPSSWLK